MRWFRFSLLTLFAVMAYVAFATAALKLANEFWAGAALTLTAVLLIVGVVAAIGNHGRARGYWLAFVLFGSAYLVASLGPWFSTNVCHQLVTSQLLVKVHAWMTPEPAGSPSLATWGASGTTLYAAPGAPVLGGMPGMGSYYQIVGQPATTYAWNPTAGQWIVTASPQQHFMVVGHSVVAFLAALLGGLVTRIPGIWPDHDTRRAATAHP
jgi:hypothetical protein